MKRNFSLFTFHFSLFTLTLALFSSCAKDEVDTWSSKSYAWFEKEATDFSFMNYPDVQPGGTAIAAIPISMAGTVADYDRQINVVISQQPKDSKTHVEVQNPVVIHKGCLQDTMYVKVTYTENLDQTPDTVKFTIQDSEEILAGINDKLETSLALYNGYTCPEWWDDDAEYYLGYFTQLKMQIYVAVTGGTEDPRGKVGTWYDNIAIDYLIQTLNDYVEENEIYYPDDDPNAPGEMPIFDFMCY